MTGPFDALPEPILVVGGYGYGNVGDEAILAGLLTRIGERQVTVVSRDPAATRALHGGVASVGIGGAAAALVRHRSVVIGGGGLFGRDMGRIGRLLPLFGLAAATFGRAVVVEGVDLDATLSASGRLLVPRLLRRAVHVSVRDGRSVAVARAWGVVADLGPDLSSWMPTAAPDEGRSLLARAGVDLRRPVVGLALTGVEPGFGAAAVAAVAEAMEALPEVQFCFLPMSRHPSVAAHDDLSLARRLARVQPRLAVLEETAHPAAVLAAFGQLAAVVAMRYHAMLFAERAGVPLVPIVYAEKNRRWLDERGLPPVEAVTEPIVAALRTALLRGGPVVPSEAPGAAAGAAAMAAVVVP